MDDWQDAVFSSRHMHNRVAHSGSNRNNRSKRNAVFDVRKTFGSYACTCIAWQKLASNRDNYDASQGVTLELYRLSPNNEGIIGEILFPGVLKATVILAASRDSLHQAVLEASSGDVESDGMSNAANGNDEGEEEEHGEDRFAIFEKNSFREPKFWLQWNGRLMPTATEKGPETKGTELGYLVFSQNDCRKFKGTINCSLLGWKNVAISGRKVATRTESDVPVAWGQV